MHPPTPPPQIVFTHNMSIADTRYRPPAVVGTIDSVQRVRNDIALIFSLAERSASLFGILADPLNEDRDTAVGSVARLGFDTAHDTHDALCRIFGIPEAGIPRHIPCTFMEPVAPPPKPIAPPPKVTQTDEHAQDEHARRAAKRSARAVDVDDDEKDKDYDEDKGDASSADDDESEGGGDDASSHNSEDSYEDDEDSLPEGQEYAYDIDEGDGAQEACGKCAVCEAEVIPEDNGVFNTKRLKKTVDTYTTIAPTRLSQIGFGVTKEKLRQIRGIVMQP